MRARQLRIDVARLLEMRARLVVVTEPKRVDAGLELFRQLGLPGPALAVAAVTSKQGEREAPHPLITVAGADASFPILLRRIVATAAAIAAEAIPHVHATAAGAAVLPPWCLPRCSCGTSRSACRRSSSRTRAGRRCRPARASGTSRRDRRAASRSSSTIFANARGIGRVAAIDREHDRSARRRRAPGARPARASMTIAPRASLGNFHASSGKNVTAVAPSAVCCFV